MSYCAALWLAVQEDLYSVSGARPALKNSTSKNSTNEDDSRSFLDDFDDYFLSQCFHLTRQCLTFILDYIKARLKKEVFKSINDTTSIETMTLATLYFYAQGFLPKKITDKLGLDHTSANEAVNIMSKVLSDMSSSFITFPCSYNDRMGVAQGFKNISSIPNVVGVLGCLHVKVTPPPGKESLFLNTLGYHSVMVQVITDVDGNLLSVEQCCPGGTQERAVWEKSNIYQEFSSFQHGQTWVVGGRGLPQGRHVLTPVVHSQIQSNAAKRFNTAHSQVLNSIQHVFGSLKTRFLCLHDLGTVQDNGLEPVSHIIKACCVVHNISKKFSVPLLGEPVLEPVHPIREMGRQGEKNPLHYMEETREDMIEMCFGTVFDDEGQTK